jgi:hypothetical protein
MHEHAPKQLFSVRVRLGPAVRLLLVLHLTAHLTADFVVRPVTNPKSKITLKNRKPKTADSRARS